MVPLRTLVIGNSVSPVAQIGTALVPLMLVPIGAVGTTNVELAWELPEPVIVDDPSEAVFPPLEAADELPNTLVWLDGETLTAELEEPPGAFEESGGALLPPVLDAKLWTGEDTLPMDVDELAGALVEPGAFVERADEPEAFVEPATDEAREVFGLGVSDGPGAFVEPLVDEMGAFVEPVADEM
jgi:hypothetical protein